MLKYHVITFGCQMNKSDSERISAIFEHLNYSNVDDFVKADFVIINACSVRQTAIDRVWGLLKKIDKIKQTRKMVSILTGCLLPEDKERFKQRFDLVFNIKNLSELETFLHNKNDCTSDDYFTTLPKSKNKFQAFVPIMTGCNNFCSYCAVPYVRGREISRPVFEILNEIKRLVEAGAKEVTLLGQNVNSYNPTDSFSADNPYSQNFAKLLWEVNQIRGIERIIFFSSHPKDLHDDVIHALSLPKMMNYLHLALQSGDNEILQKMNRLYTEKDFSKLIAKVRKVKPDMAIGTDIIVGFPGETKEQFEATLNLYEKLRLDISYHSMYSPRQGTKAEELNDDVSYEEKKKRWFELQALVKKITLEKNQKYVNIIVEVLIDKVAKTYCEGNSLEMKRVRVGSGFKLGDLIKVKINKAQEWVLIGEAV